MSLAQLYAVAAMMNDKGNMFSITPKEAEAKLKANKDKLLPKLNVLKESGEGLVQFVNFVEVLRRQLKSGGLRVGRHGLHIWQLLDILEHRRNGVLQTVQRHKTTNLTDTTMAEAVDAHLEDFKDAVLFTEENLMGLYLTVNVQNNNTKNPTVTRKRMPHCKMAAYFQVLTLLKDAFEIITADNDSDDE